MIIGLSEASEPDKKRRFWGVDPSAFVTKGKFGAQERVSELLRAVGKYFLWGLILTYPFTLPLIGIVFGGLAFWGAFGGSILLMAALLSRFGLAKNFENRDTSIVKSVIGPCGGFLCALGFYLGIAFLQGWLFPVTMGVLGLVFLVALWRRGF